MSTQVKTMTPMQEVANSIMAMKPEFEEILRKTGIDPDRFTRVAILAIQQTPALLECTKPSLYKAVSTCARWGLIPDGQEAAIVKFGNEAVAMDMIEGVLKLFRNSGECGCVDAKVVFEKDAYQSWIDEKGPHFKHVAHREKDKGVPILTYAYAITKDGHIYFEEVTEDEMQSIKKVARTKMVWDGDFKYEMYRKSALRRLSKRLPKSTDIEMAMDRHDESFDLDKGDDRPAAEEQTTSSRLSNVLDVKATVKTESAAPVVAAAAAPAQQEEAQDPPMPHKEGPQEPKTVQGLISNIKIKSAPPGTKPYWTRYGAQIDANWFGTFDKNIYNEMDKCHQKRILVEITYTETSKDNKIYFECKSIRQLNSDDIKKEDVVGGMPF
jgi:recombination protein RecT